MGRSVDKISRKTILGLTWGRRAWDGMQGRGELRMGFGGDKICRKTILGLSGEEEHGMVCRGDAKRGTVERCF